MVLNNIPVVHVNKHPILLDHDTRVVLEAKPGESLFAFLSRNDVDTTNMQVSVNGRVIDAVEWHHVKMTDGKEVVLRSTVHKSALYIVAMVALLYFTGGAAAAVMSGGSFGGIVTAGAIAGMSTAASMAAIGAVQIVGAMLINKVLGPRVPSASNIERGSAYNIAAARNAARQWETVGILFGSYRVTPDFAAQAFNYYKGNDQYMQMLLTPGINVARYDSLYFGDTLLSSYAGVNVKKRGFSAMLDDVLTSTTNVDTIAGGELDANIPIVRTTPADVVRVQVDLQYLLFDLTSKGKKKDNQETVQVFMRKVGDTTWQLKGSHFIRNREQTDQRRSFFYDVENGTYDVRVNRLGQDTDGSGATCKFTLVSVVAYQESQNDFDGVSVIQIDMKGTGQLNGAPDEVRAIMYADPLPLWTGTEWITVSEPGANGTSNPGAQALQYARGFRSETGKLVAGMGLDDDQIDMDAFKALMVHCANNNIQYNMWVQDERNHKEFLDAILYPAMGRISFAPGRLTPMWAREEQGSSGSVNMATIKKAEFQVNYTLVNAADGVEFTFIDRLSWETKTLRVPLPGTSVEDMRNPATISGEGIIDEAQAAAMARYHLGQTIYQAKDISYSTSLQFLAYQEMDLLDLQHDLTQWGYGGRLIDIRNVGGVITLDLDFDVPGRDASNAWIGLHLPDEMNYRVFKVVPFTGESSTITLADPWPSDAQFPANIGTKAVHDTTWIYDFKQTPGKRVRVVGMTPDDDLNGASVSVVPEDAEFWNFVKTGNYVPPNNDSQLNVKPIAENLSISENVIVQGDTTFTELQANWTVSNNSVRNVVTCAMSGEDPQIVAETTGISASWRIYREGVYIVTVRPYAENGTPGVAVTTVYNTEGTDVPPVNVDSINVVDIGSGIRKYTWSFYPDTIQSPDMAGVEIRYTAGAVSAPVWDDMTPVGDDGFYTAAFESAVPAVGQWTFAIRTRNTSGTLSSSILLAVFDLPSSIVQIISETTAELVAQQAKVDAALAAALAADLKAAKSLVLLGEEYDAASTYLANDVVYLNGRMYRALANVPLDSPPPNPLLWQDVGTVTQAQSGNAKAISQLRTDVDGQAIIIDQVESGMASVTNAIKAVGGGGNLIANADMSVDLSGWYILWNDGGWLGPARNAAGSNYYPPGINTVSAYLPGVTSRTMYLDIANTTPIPVAKEKKYCFSVYMNPSRCAQQIFVYWLDSLGDVVSYSPASEVVDRHNVSLPGSNLGANWVRGKIVVLAPANAAKARLVFRAMALAGQDTPYPFWCRPMFEEVAPLQEEPSPWSIGGQEQAASHSVTLDVGGNISGTQSMNDGKRSSFSILANIFRVISSASSGLEWQNGYLRAYSAGIQLVLGINFGAASNLCFWYGPNVGVANCNKSNGTIWFDNIGGAYFGGSLSAGVKKNAVQTTTTVTVGTELVNGPFDTNGTVRQVTISFARDTVYISNAFGTTGFVAGAGSNTAQVLVYRKIGNAAEALWQTLNVGGGVNIFNNADAPDRANAYWSGSMTVNDTSPAGSTVTYRAVITAFTSQDVSHPGTINSINTTQNLAMISVEN